MEPTGTCPHLHAHDPAPGCGMNRDRDATGGWSTTKVEYAVRYDDPAYLGGRVVAQPTFKTAQAVAKASNETHLDPYPATAISRNIITSAWAGPAHQ